MSKKIKTMIDIAEEIILKSVSPEIVKASLEICKLQLTHRNSFIQIGLTPEQAEWQTYLLMKATFGMDTERNPNDDNINFGN